MATFWIALADVSGASGARAATRTVQFLGVAVNEPTTMEVGNWATFISCVMTVVNSGTTDQKIMSILFSRLDPSATSKTSIETEDSTSDSTYIQTKYFSGTNSGTSCIDKKLEPGAVCMIKFLQNTYPWTGRLGWCGGRLTVKDETATKPGSVMASGAIIMNQEAMVLGGVLSGAFYASNTHVQKESNGTTWPSNMADSNTPKSGAAPDIASSYDAANMNYYCTAACMSYGKYGPPKSNSGLTANNSGDFSEEMCEEHCGIRCVTSLAEGSSVDVRDGEWCRNMPMFTQHVNKPYFVSGGLPSGAGVSTVAAVTNTGLTTLGDNRTSPAMIRTANPHFSGGMVYEMISGPLVSVCSGNKQYFEDGGIDFTHSDGVDSHAVYKENKTYLDGPPERLLCSHRHGRTDLFMRVGSTSPIVVNGGNPF